MLSMSNWLRRSLAVDVAPCSGAAISAGTEDEHGVPEPDLEALGMTEEEAERGLTRSFAQSLRIDSRVAQDAPTLENERRPGLRSHGDELARQATVANRPARNANAPARFVAGETNRMVGGGAGQLPHHALNPAPPQGYAGARMNRVTGIGY